MKKIDREKLRDNILYFGKLKGLKIGEIETLIGRRLGLISRWANKKPETISLDVVYNIAVLLDVTIDDLISSDTTELRKALEKQQKLDDLKLQRAIINNQIAELLGEYGEN